VIAKRDGGRRRLVRAVGVAATPVLAALVAVVVSAHSASLPPAKDQTPALPASPAPGLRVPAPVDLPSSPRVTYWASVRSAVFARAAPSASAERVARLPTTTPEGTANIVLVLGRRRDRAGRVWIHVRLAIRPNGSTGWIPRRALGVYGMVRTRLVVDVERLTAILLRDGRAIFQAPIGVGKAGSPTPKGQFYVRDMLTDYRSPFYGPVAFGTSARSDVLTDWPRGGYVGIHGTNTPALLPGRVSHGCIRLRNEDIVELARLMPVGTPVTIR